MVSQPVYLHVLRLVKSMRRAGFPRDLFNAESDVLSTQERRKYNEYWDLSELEFEALLSQ